MLVAETYIVRNGQGVFSALYRTVGGRYFITYGFELMEMQEDAAVDLIKTTRQANKV